MPGSKSLLLLALAFAYFLIDSCNAQQTLSPKPTLKRKCTANWFFNEDGGLQTKKMPDGSKIYSQSYQDAVLMRLFDMIGTRNRYCVEFGFGYVDEDLHGAALLLKNSGLNTRRLKEVGWNSTFFDAVVADPTINLKRVVLTQENIADEFRKAGLPLEIDYVSIDVDSIEAWLLLGLLQGGYRPRVFSVEFNTAFRPHDLVSHQKEWHPWNRSMVFGASAGTLNMVATMFGYKLVARVRKLDLFFVRADILDAVCPPSIQPEYMDHMHGVGSKILHGPPKSTEEAERLVDFPLALMGLTDAARKKAQLTLQEMGVRIGERMFKK
uniref:Methyltransferase FkbM domain-containing protein n=1 Tax=Chrysotila carterae TaxID=13221 RepID=A0A7S4F6S0_CHRCT|mmetsp:Transcript_17743/g.37511  ORF Transcript_17743/g.37511 Transcript_17743/m.37511 type:complete len:324 (+) Transcript_17743:124-1095(+)